MTGEQGDGKGDIYVGNIWGTKWTKISIVIIMIVMILAVCRYMVVQPDQLIRPEDVEQFE